MRYEYDRKRCNPIVVIEVSDENVALSYAGDIMIIKLRDM
jgi:hypothetical protein